MSDRQKVPNAVLRHIREQERHETRSEFAEAMARKAAELGEAVYPSERYVARLEDGEVSYPHPPYRRVLAALCERSVSELGFASSNAIGEAVQLRDNGASAFHVYDAQDGSAFFGPSLQEIELIRTSLHEMVGDNPMSEAAIEDWEQTVLQHARATRYQPPSMLLVSLMTDITDLKNEIGRCRSASALRRLTRVTAQMAGLVCLTLVKLDERSASRRWARTARVAAGEAGDPLTLAWVRAQEAYGCYYSGNISEAIDIAQHAQAVVPGVPCVGAALAAALEARAQARLGRRAETQQALRRAETVLAELDASSTLPSAFSYNEAQLRFHEGSAYTQLQDTKSAWIAQSRALELVPENDYTDRTLTHLDRAVCLAHDGDSGGAVDYAARALTDLTADQRQGIIALRAHEMFNAIPARQRSLPAVREFRDLMMLPSGNPAKDDE
jgi:tetratricopeptide (TPR) repeat protein